MRPAEPPAPRGPRRQRDTVHDPRVLRAIAHPVRTRILEELSAAGPMRAADLARTLGVPANQASFHLRQLAKYALVVEAPELARDGRDRVWRVAHDRGLSIDTRSLAEMPGGRAAVSVFQQSWTEAAHDAVDRAAADGERPAPAIVSDTSLRLTAAEARELSEAIGDLVEAWKERGRTQTGTEGRLTHQLLQILQPARSVAEEADGADRA
ncbi:MAG: transcriptional regulator, ArsR family [Marmoricola sp.]|nr:transcriptional regulator, ArsR family [Marmoricola sp.]